MTTARDPLAGTTPSSTTRPVVTSDDRVSCHRCGNLAGSGRCLAAARGELSYAASRNYSPVVAFPRRCEGFKPRGALPQGAHR